MSTFPLPFGQTHPEIFLPQRDPGLGKFFIPPVIELPFEAELKALSYQFKTVPVLQVKKLSMALDTDFLCWGITGFSTDPLGFSFQIYQDHVDRQRAWFNKHQRQANAAGTAQFPFLLREVVPVAQGDALMVEIKNLANVNTTSFIEIVLYGGVPA
jgi:hypothetical protein